MSYISFNFILSDIEKNEQASQQYLLNDIRTQINLSFNLLDKLLAQKKRDYLQLHQLARTLILDANSISKLQAIQKILEKKADFPVELYIINADLKITETTFPPDLGLDFSASPFRDVKNYLKKVRQTGQIAVGQPNIEFISKKVKIYSMSVLDDNRYLELGFIDPDFNEYFKSLNDYISSREDAKISMFIEFWDKILIPMTFIPEKNTKNKITLAKQSALKTKSDQLAFNNVTSNDIPYQIHTTDAQGKKISSYYIQLEGFSGAFIKEYSTRYLAKIVFDEKKVLLIKEQFKRFLLFSLVLSISGILIFALYIRHWLIKPLNLVLSAIQNKSPVNIPQLLSGSHELKKIALTYNETLDHLNKSILELERQSTTDPLTGLDNRRKFAQLYEQEISRARRNHLFLALIMIDVDNFKEHNDLYGHHQGDQLLIDLARQMEKRFLRPSDHLCRMGGDEFSALLIDIDPSTIVSVFESLQQAWTLEYHNNIPRTIDTNDLKVSVSIGIYVFNSTLSPSWESAYQRADAALYKAKNRGRNLIEMVEDSA
ncbi:MAG: diguanylate cyclase [Gammaproteobacteria bacterium]|nr:diguanylate cyclase [Gammaproteobacteria bacterium]